MPPEVVVVLLRVVHRGDARVRLVEAHMGAYVAKWDGVPDDQKDLEREGALKRLARDQRPREGHCEPGSLQLAIEDARGRRDGGHEQNAGSRSRSTRHDRVYASSWVR